MNDPSRDVNTQAPPDGAAPPAAEPGPGATRPGKGRDRLHDLLAPIGSVALFVVILAAWFGATRAGLISPIILPGPIDVGAALIDTLASGFFYEHLAVTTYEVLMGFFIGTVGGFTLGAILGIFPFVRKLSWPYVIAFQGLPKVVLAPLFVTMFGFGVTSKIAMAVAISFFPILINTMTGLMTVDADAQRLMRSLAATRMQIFFKLSLPHAMPLVFAGLKTGLTLALVGAIVGEFVGASQGIGYLLGVYAFQLDVARVWALTILLAALGVVLFLSIEYAQRKLIFWQGSSSTPEM